MTTEELDKRIKALRFGEFEIIDHGEAFWTIPDKDIPRVKKLISDCVDAVIPPARPEEIVHGVIRVRGEDVGYNAALEAIRANKRNLLGER